jgi:transmembrane sensor
MPESGHDGKPDDEALAAASLEREATEWFFRRDGGFTSEDERAFRRWLNEDERHGRTFADIENTWCVLSSAREQVMIPQMPGKRAAARRQRHWWPGLALAAAAVVAFSCTGWFVARHLGFGGVPATAPLAFAEQASTGFGGLQKMDLPDGSFVTLNADSAADVQFSRLERRVRLLRGEAHFTVAKDVRRPFAVEANGIAVKAVGTAFNVRLQPETVEVLVTAGKVQVEDAAHGRSLLSVSASIGGPPSSASEAQRVLQSGEKVVIPVKIDAAPLPAIALTISAREIEAAIAWQERRLEYSDAPLSEIVADFNRFNRHQIVIADPNLASRRFGGAFPAGDHQSLVQVLENTFEVAVERRERETILRLP